MKRGDTLNEALGKMAESRTGARGVFIDDVVRHAKSAVTRVRKDHWLFRKDHTLEVVDTV